VRRVFISLAQKQLLFEGKITEKLKLVNSFTTTDISNIERQVFIYSVFIQSLILLIKFEKQ
jgi:hypothetical protein